MRAESVQTDETYIVINWPAVMLTMAVLAAVVLVVVLVVRRVRRTRAADRYG